MGHSPRPLGQTVTIAPSIPFWNSIIFPKGSRQSGQSLYLFLLGLAPGVSMSTQCQRYTYHEVTSHRHWRKSQSIIGDFISDVHELPLVSFSWPSFSPKRPFTLSLVCSISYEQSFCLGHELSHTASLSWFYLVVLLPIPVPWPWSYRLLWTHFFYNACCITLCLLDCLPRCP